MSVLPLYVTEITFDNENIDQQELLYRNGDIWLRNDVVDLFSYIVYNNVDLGDPDKGVEVTIEDFDELAQWCLDNGIKEYDKSVTVETSEDKEVDITLDGQDYKFVFLVSDVLEDFLSDAIDDIHSLDSIPDGLQLTKYSV